jgi:putative transposase
VKREAIATMVIEHELSERRACALVGLSRDAYRNPAPESALNTQLSAQIIEIAHTRRRAGYRMIHDLLRPDNPGINHKRIYRLYSEAGLTVRRESQSQTLRRARVADSSPSAQSDMEHGFRQR